MISSLGTLRLSEERSLSSSVAGRSRNSWFFVTWCKNK